MRCEREEREEERTLSSSSFLRSLRPFYFFEAQSSPSPFLLCCSTLFQIPDSPSLFPSGCQLTVRPPFLSSSAQKSKLDGRLRVDLPFSFVVLSFPLQCPPTSSSALECSLPTLPSVLSYSVVSVEKNLELTRLPSHPFHPSPRFPCSPC